jgi:hypothetical protein
MGVSQEVKEMLQQGQDVALAELAAANPRSLRPLLGRLWDPDRTIRTRAARAIGIAAAAHPERGLEVVRRLMWALNDESATNGVYGVPALGQIGRSAPEMLADFVPALVAMVDDAGLRLELLRALCAIAESAPRRVAVHLDRLARSVDDTQPEEREAFSRLVALTKESKR